MVFAMEQKCLRPEYICSFIHLFGIYRLGSFGNFVSPVLLQLFQMFVSVLD